jgi:hypothetical protein
MQLITIGYGLILMAIGIIGYLASGGASATALIPAVFGVLALAFGFMALNEKYRMHAMHGVVLIGILALLGSARGVPGALAVITGGEVERPQAAIAQGLMALLSLVFVVLCVNSFIQARRNRKKAEADAAQS